MYVCLRACERVCLRTCACMCVCVCACVHLCVHACLHVQENMRVVRESLWLLQCQQPRRQAHIEQLGVSACEQMHGPSLYVTCVAPPDGCVTGSCCLSAVCFKTNTSAERSASGAGSGPCPTQRGSGQFLYLLCGPDLQAVDRLRGKGADGQFQVCPRSELSLLHGVDTRLLSLWCVGMALSDAETMMPCCPFPCAAVVAFLQTR